MHNFHFDDQYHTYHSVGSCIAPEGQRPVGNAGQKGTDQPSYMKFWLLGTHEHRRLVNCKNTVSCKFSDRQWVYSLAKGISLCSDASVYGPEVKRRKTEEEKKAEKERKAEREAQASSADPTVEWSIGQRQPWAERQVQPARPTEEQLAWLKEEGFIKEEEEGEEGDKVSSFAAPCYDRRQELHAGLRNPGKRFPSIILSSLHIHAKRTPYW